MIEKIKRKKKVSKQDITKPKTIDDLIRKYDLDDKDIYDYLDYIVDYLNDDIAGIQQLITNQYDSTQTYSVGDYCIYNNILYKCIIAINIAESWNPSKWTATNISVELENRLEFETVDTW